MINQMDKPGFWQKLLSILHINTNTYNPQALVPLDFQNWDEWGNRLFRYQHYKFYLHNVIYRDLVKYTASQRAKSNLYRHIRPIFNPIGREVKLYKSQVYGGVLDMENGSDGAMPIVADKKTTDAILQLWRWSNMQELKNVLVHDGTLNGDAFIKVVDDPVKGRVRLELIDPSWVVDMKKDSSGQVTEILIGYVTVDEETEKDYLYAEHITEASFTTFKDGVEFTYQTDLSGTPRSSWANVYGFVPVVHVPHYDIGNMFGATPFEDCLTKIDEINDFASNLNDQVRKAVTPVWAFSGVSGKKDITESDPQRDAVKAVYLPDGATSTALISNLSIGEALQVLRNMLDELTDDMPELSFSKLTSLGTIPSGVALQTMFQTGAKRIQEAQGNYNAGVIRAQQMALIIGQANRYDNFGGLPSDMTVDNPQHSIKLNPIFPDELTKKERIDTLLAGEFPPAVILDELGFGEDDIKAIVAVMELRDAAAVRGLLADVMTNPQAAGQTPIGQDPANILQGNPAQQQAVPPEGADDGEDV